MKVLQQSLVLLQKELLVEWRLKYALGALLLYVLSTVFVIYFSLTYQSAIDDLQSVMWSILFWLVILFASVNATARSFMQESQGKMLYYYTLISPQAFILGKILYNFVITLILATLSVGIFMLVIGNPIVNLALFFLSVVLGASCYSFLFTLVSAIASKAGNSSTLGVVLGFPLVIPLLIYIVKISREALREELTDFFIHNLAILGAFNVILIVLSLILFPYIWRD
jgi:heme exporter protein B